MKWSVLFCATALAHVQQLHWDLNLLCWWFSFKSFTSHVGEAAEQQSQEEIEDDQISHQNGGQKVGHAGGPGDVHAVPHGLDPLSAQHPEDDHETVHEVGEVPAGQLAVPLLAHFVGVILAKKLHAHHSEDEYDNAEDEGEVGQGAHGVGHDCQNVVERLPRFGQFEDAEETEGSQHGQALDTFGQQFHQGEDDDEEVETVPAILKIIIKS